MFLKLRANMLKKWCFFILLFINYQISFASDKVVDACNLHNCRMIVDVGSSGSRLHVYAYDKDNQENLININEVLVNKIKPGLSALEPTQVPEYLTKLMQNATNLNLQIDFYGTAGMRLLPLDKQYALYSAVRDWFAKQQKWHLIETRNISGTEEGLYGWIAIYNQRKDLLEDLPGFMEIGGASLQIVFPINDLSNIKSEDIISFKLNNKTITLFSHSFLGFGANEITKKFASLQSCLPIGFPLEKDLVGTGDINSCQAEIINNLNENEVLSKIVKLPLNKNPVSTWVTVGAISSISHTSPLSLTTEEFSIGDLYSKIDSTYCKQAWDFQIKNYTDDYLQYNCLMGAFFYGLTTNVYGIDSNQTFKTFKQGSEPDWTLGALIINSSHSY